MNKVSEGPVDCQHLQYVDMICFGSRFPMFRPLERGDSMALHLVREASVDMVTVWGGRGGNVIPFPRLSLCTHHGRCGCNRDVTGTTWRLGRNNDNSWSWIGRIRSLLMRSTMLAISPSSLSQAPAGADVVPMKSFTHC